MSQEQSLRQQKRQEALNRLRQNRGKERRSDLTEERSEVEATKILFKGYPNVESPEAQAQLSQILPLTGEAQTLSKTSKVKERVEKQDQEILAAMERIKAALKARRNRKQQQAKEEEEEELTFESTQVSKRQQLINDALATDFFRNTMQWLGSMDSDPEFSSTSVEEMEELKQQAQYRYKALKVMLEETQRELDFIELQIQNRQSFSAN